MTPKVTLASANKKGKGQKLIDLDELGFTRLEDRPFTRLDDRPLLSADDPVEEGDNQIGSVPRKPAILWGILASAVAYCLVALKKDVDSTRVNQYLESFRGGLQKKKIEPEQPKRTPADDHPLALQNQAIIQEKGFFRWLISPEKLPWTLSALLSTVFLIAFLGRVSCDKTQSFSQKLCWKQLIPKTQGLHNGFCVWGSDPDTGLCPNELENSHQYSFYVDMALTVLTFAIGHAVKPHASFAFTTAIGLLVGLHGLLHWGISNGIQCDDNGSNNGIISTVWKHCWMSCPGVHPTPAKPWQWILYTIYNLGLVLLDFGVANFRLPIPLQVMLVILVSAVFVAMGAYWGGTWALPGVFVQSHIMASFTGMFANQEKLTPLTGWCFLAATAVGLTEFLACEPFLLKRYGHVWYDAVLHLAMISTLVPRGKLIPTAP